MQILKILLLVGSIPIAPIFTDESSEKEKYLVQLVIKEGDPRGSLNDGTIRIRHDIRLIATLGEKANLIIGGEYRVGGEPIQVGRIMTASVNSSENGQLDVRGTYEDSHPIISEGVMDVTKALYLRSSVIHFAETMTPGSSVQHVVQKDDVPWLDRLFGKSHELWIELTVERVTEPTAQ